MAMRRTTLILFTLIYWLECVTAANVTVDTSDCPPGTDCAGEGRTFGIGHRRKVMFMLPVMFKLGVIVTLLVGLTVMAFKGLAIGVILLVLAFGGLFSKLKTERPAGQSWPTPPINLYISDPNKMASSPGSYSLGYDRIGEIPAPWQDYYRKWSAYHKNQNAKEY